MQKNETAVEDPRRDQDVGVDGPEWDFEAAGKRAAPALGLATGILVADEKRRLHFPRKASRVSGARRTTKPISALGRVFCYVA
jgi:hypothetical protein